MIFLQNQKRKPQILKNLTFSSNANFVFYTKKKIFVAIAFFFVSTIAVSENFSFSITPIFGKTSGVLEEKIYNSSKNHEIISLLEWERDIFFAGAGANLSKKNGFRADALFLFGVGENFGEMRDSDWLNTSDRTMKTHFSVGENNSIVNFYTTLDAGWNFDFGVFSFSPLAQAQFNYDSFERKNAEGWYSQNDSTWWFDESSTHYPHTEWSDEKGRFVKYKLAGVSYERLSLYAWIGAEFKANLSKRLSFFAGAFFSPFAYTYATDTHHGSGNQYRQIQTGYFSKIKFSFGGEFLISKRFSILICGEQFLGWTDRGELFVKDGDSTKFYLNPNQPTGSTAQSFSVQIGLKIKIF